jgi:hypothetical protein
MKTNLPSVTSIPSEVDWARLAAFIDGEGCISLVRYGERYTCLRIQIANTNRTLVEWCQGLCGGSVHIRKPRKATHKTSYSLMVASALAGRVIKNCYPYFILKQEQARVALEFLTTIDLSISNYPALTAVRKQKRAQLIEQMHVLNRKGPKVA